MPQRELHVYSCEKQTDIERAYQFIDELRRYDDMASRSPTVQRYLGLFSSMPDVRRAHTQELFRPSLIYEMNRSIIIGVGSVALQRTVFHPTEGEMISSEIDYVTSPDITDAEHIQVANFFYEQQQRMNSQISSSCNRRRYPSFASLVADNPYQARGVPLSSVFYEVDGSGHLQIDPDLSNVSKNAAIVALHHSK